MVEIVLWGEEGGYWVCRYFRLICKALGTHR